MKTSHQLAAELLALPDLPLSVDRWGGEEIEIHVRSRLIDPDDLDSWSDVVSFEPAEDGFRISLKDYPMVFVPTEISEQVKERFNNIPT